MTVLPLILFSSLLFSILIPANDAFVLPNIRDLKARYHPQTNSIFVEWTFPPPTENVRFNVRYKTNRAGGEDWRFLRSSDTMVRLNLPNLSEGDELHVQVNAERGGQVIEDWSQTLVITVSRKPMGEGGSEGPMLLPPTDFTANILDTTSVKLDWTPSEETTPGHEIFYIVNVKQLTTKSGGVLQRQQIKTAAGSFTMGRLIPGEKYEITIRSALSDTRVSSTAAIVEITMPKEEEFFEIGNLIISSLFKSSGSGTVNLTWDVPPQMSASILGYEVQYVESGHQNWEMVKFVGAHSSASLDRLKSDTEYLLKIKTLLKNDVFTESGQFNFKTPKVQQNPIRKVDVIYSHEVNSVRLQWMLEPYINLSNVVGYDVYVSEHKDWPETHWKHIPLHTREAVLSLPGLKSLTTYYVRVNIRQQDGTVIKAPSLYRFKTIDASAETAEVREANALSYRNLVPGTVTVSWTFPQSVADKVIGSAIFYTENKQLPLDSWKRVNVHDATNTSVVLTGLREGTRYFVRIVPRVANGEFDFSTEQDFEMHTDTRERFDEQLRAHHPSLGGSGRVQHLQQHPEKAFMRLSSCDPDSIREECALDELCVSVATSNLSWCIPHSLRDAILLS